MKKKYSFLFLICYLSYTAIYVARLNLSMASPALKAAGMLTSAQLGLLGSAFSVVYALGRLFNGALSDRVPPQKMISIGLAATGLSNLTIGLLPPFFGILLCWSANAFAQSMLWSSVLCTLAYIYPPDIVARKTSAMVTTVATGNILGILLNLYLIDHFGLRWAFLIPGAVTLVLGAVTAASLRSIPAPAAKAAAPHIGMSSLLQNREVRLAVLPAVFHGVMKDNITLWMTVFFTDRFGIDLEQSAMFVLFIPTIGFLGRTLYPVCYRLCRQQEHRVSQYAFTLCILSACTLCVIRSSPFIAMVCLSLVYAAVSLVNTSFLSIFPLHFHNSGNVASVSGLMDFFTYLGAGIASLVYGLLIDHFGYSPMFFSWVLLSAVSLLLLHKLCRMQQ